MDSRVERVEDAIITLNKEMGVVQGELVWIRRLMTATVLVALGQLFSTLLT